MTRLSTALAVALALALAACGPSGDDDDDATCEADLLAGDLVITEVQADLAGVDDGKEWFEIYNGTAAPVSLVGLTLVHAKNDSTGEKTHVMQSGEIPAGGYFVVAGILDEFKADYMDYGFGDELGSLRNTNGLLALRCGGDEIDSVTYDAVDEAASLAFDGGVTPDHTANDVLANWCASQSGYGTAGELGTPQAANDPCGLSGTCNDGGSAREVVSPEVGDLVITEFMADSAAVLDADGEWFEVYVASPVDLNGLEIGKTLDSTETLTSADCLSFAAGSYVLFAKSDDPLVNGGMDNVDFTFGFGLTNSDSSIALGLGGTLLDQVTWTSTDAGVSTSLDPSATDPTDNDNPANFCPAIVAYGDGDLGTPGEPNDDCVFAGECVDLGSPRGIDRPTAGEVVITEVMPNPNGTDSVGEWFELYAAGDFDLNELELGQDFGSGPDMTIQSVSCLPVTAGSYILFARELDPGVNGGMDNVDYTFSFTLTNNPGSVFAGSEGALLDQIGWTADTPGDSKQFDPTLVTDPSATTLNDNESNFCAAPSSYGSGGNGTPGAANVCL